MKKLTRTSLICAAIFGGYSMLAVDLPADNGNPAAAGLVKQLKAEQGNPTRYFNEKVAAAKQAIAMKQQGAHQNSLLDYYVVDAMSNIKRNGYNFPADGKYFGTVEAIMAQGEVESASLLLYPFTDFKDVKVTVSDLKNSQGAVIPKANVDVRVVKVWVQTGIGWYSYFADTAGRELIPELLVHDENLVKVDEKNMENYLRVTAPRAPEQYVWISNPLEINVPVDAHKENIADTDTLQPFALENGQFKQLWITIESPKNVEGVFNGTITVSAGNQTLNIPLTVRVLPFELPDPKTNYSLERDYYTSSYNANNLKSYVQGNGGDWAKAEQRLLNEYKSFRKHNLLQPMLPTFRDGNDKEFKRQLEIYQQAGLRTDVVFDAVRGIPDYGYLTSQDRKLPVKEQKLPPYWAGETLGGLKVVKSVFGPDTVVYCFGWDEPGMGILRAQRAPWKFLNDNGLKTYSTAHHKHLLHAGFNEDFVNYGGDYSKEESGKWHAMGGRITSYASPHTGIENPDFVRRTHGMDLYLADCDGTNNYMVSGSEWNDFVGADYNFRAFNWVYPGSNGHIDTIQFAGFREAIDDVRYATLMQQLAQKAINSGKTELVYQGRIAMQYLSQLDGKKIDLNEVRLELINHILKLRALLK